MTDLNRLGPLERLIRQDLWIDKHGNVRYRPRFLTLRETAAPKRPSEWTARSFALAALVSTLVLITPVTIVVSHAIPNVSAGPWWLGPAVGFGAVAVAALPGVFQGVLLTLVEPYLRERFRGGYFLRHRALTSWWQGAVEGDTDAPSVDEMRYLARERPDAWFTVLPWVHARAGGHVHSLTPASSEFDEAVQDLVGALTDHRAQQAEAERQAALARQTQEAALARHEAAIRAEQERQAAAVATRTNPARTHGLELPATTEAGPGRVIDVPRPPRS